MNITQTDAGPAVIVLEHLTILESEKWGTKGSVALAILLNDKKQPECWCLLWEWGGDWTGFGDDDRYDSEKLNGWEPDAVREAVAAAVAAIPRCAEDMDWFLEWADDADATLERE